MPPPGGIFFALKRIRPLLLVFYFIEMSRIVAILNLFFGMFIFILVGAK